MKPTIRTIILSAALATLGAVSGSAGAHQSHNAALYGSAAANSSALRQIAITPDTRWVNVTDGETVEFNLDGRSFSWRFDTLRGEGAFDLSSIAPEGANLGKIKVYVASNPLYNG
jgi:hypothetical protein